MLRTLITAFLLLAQGSILLGAQAMNGRADASSVPKISQPLPFKVGEKLTYEVSFSRFIFSGAIGQIDMTVAKASDLKNPDLIELKAEAVSKGFFPKLFGIKVKDEFRSVVNRLDFGLHTSTKLIDEGKLKREQKSMFDREAGRVTYIERDLANADAEPKVKEATHPAWIQDVLSAIYFVRTRKLTEGEVIPVPISDGGQVYNIEIVAGKREKIKVDAGKFNAVMLDAKVFDGRYIKRSGEMFVWVTDDSKRIPVRAKIKTSGVTVTIELQRIQKSEG